MVLAPLYCVQIYEKTQYHQTKHAKNNSNEIKKRQTPQRKTIFLRGVWLLLPRTCPLAGIPAILVALYDIILFHLLQCILLKLY